jgi:hypothetical protein
VTGISLLFLLLCSFFVGLMNVQPASAAQTVPYKINFQGRLADATGTAKPNGQYNMTFRLYGDLTGGSAVWTEVREQTNRVTVTNGQFNVQLGDVTALSPSILSDSTLFFEIELPTPATATCSTASCASYTEGAMGPRQALAAGAFAMNADQIDGIDGSSLARNDASNTFSSSNTFNGNVTIGSSNSSSKFVIYDNSSTALFTADTSSTIVKVGTTSAATLANVRLLTTSAEFTGTVRIGTATDGVDISATNGIVLSGTARRTKTVTLVPEYQGATFQGDGTNNIGSLTSDFCSKTGSLQVNTSACPTTGDAHNYYQWVSNDIGAQDYDIYVRYRLPSDYDTGSMTNLSAYNYTSSNDGANYAYVYLYDNAGTNCASLTTSGASDTWAQATAASPIGSCTGIVANGYITFKIRLAVSSTVNKVRIGSISFDYRSKF